MRNTIVFLALVLVPLLLSLKKAERDKFTGTWFWRAEYFDDSELDARKGAVESQAINKIIIKKDGERYLLTHDVPRSQLVIGGVKMPRQRTYVYTFRNDSLIGMSGLGYVALIKPSGHLLWNNQEWEKAPAKGNR